MGPWDRVGETWCPLADKAWLRAHKVEKGEADLLVLLCGATVNISAETKQCSFLFKQRGRYLFTLSSKIHWSYKRLIWYSEKCYSLSKLTTHRYTLTYNHKLSWYVGSNNDNGWCHWVCTMCQMIFIPCLIESSQSSTIRLSSFNRGTEWLSITCPRSK